MNNECYCVCQLALSRKMLTWKPWKLLTEEPLANQWKWPILNPLFNGLLMLSMIFSPLIQGEG